MFKLKIQYALIYTRARIKMLIGKKTTYFEEFIVRIWS